MLVIILSQGYVFDSVYCLNFRNFPIRTTWVWRGKSEENCKEETKDQ